MKERKKYKSAHGTASEVHHENIYPGFIKRLDNIYFHLHLDFLSLDRTDDHRHVIYTQTCMYV